MSEAERKEVIPTGDDENVGKPVFKREKKRKTKEEKMADRKLVVWSIVIFVFLSILFYLGPKIKNRELRWPNFGWGIDGNKEIKNYVEYKL